MQSAPNQEPGSAAHTVAHYEQRLGAASPRYRDEQHIPSFPVACRPGKEGSPRATLTATVPHVSDHLIG